MMEKGKEKQVKEEKEEQVLIVGAGLVGSLMATFLAKRGLHVTVYERRPDPREEEFERGRSINLALSTRGITSLSAAGLEKDVMSLGIPMYGRMIHPKSGTSTHFQQYGVRSDQHLLSISRGGLNEKLISKAEECGVTFKWKHVCQSVDLNTTTATFLVGVEQTLQVSAQLIIGADGAFSKVRQSMQRRELFNYSQSYLDHGYKEVVLPADTTNKDVPAYKMHPNSLHIWPRGKFMMIGLPNLDKSYTITLFMPWEKFNTLKTKEQVLAFFREEFPDSIPLIENPEEQYFENPTGSLVSIKCKPFHINSTVIIGDAAHAVVPFYGQGMNAGFEDCKILDELIEKHLKAREGEAGKVDIAHSVEDFQYVIGKALEEYSVVRKVDVDAISDLSQQNYIEMRDRVQHSDYLIRKKLDWILNKIAPQRWIPLYSMVSFSNIPYSEVIRRAKKQDKIVRQVSKYGLLVGLLAVTLFAKYRRILSPFPFGCFAGKCTQTP